MSSSPSLAEPLASSPAGKWMVVITSGIASHDHRTRPGMQRCSKAGKHLPSGRVTAGDEMIVTFCPPPPLCLNVRWYWRAEASRAPIIVGEGMVVDEKRASDVAQNRNTARFRLPVGRCAGGFHFVHFRGGERGRQWLWLMGCRVSAKPGAETT